ncbi:Aldehyde dehydrogenase [Planococcus halocryophilus Or1]|uniref:3-sulfolactaldehyde dehydrogenase n=1 Tax=Planococcus halocryophilus TaxID=1215089 RepID=A0A1C7DPK0_9BACL|nr:aldehyde dehydrogenase family protein [Planococcus halocryophilus]ANU13143.1 aldehyde dehydrogenase [Planococcus halocryophilus]EMF47949.1 Aldehyde dehydrogenase [Planococcus halocryophilus Or1]
MKTDYSKIYIDGEWTTGSSDSQMKNTNPFTGEELVTTQAADKSDLDKAYKAAAKAQVAWSKELPQKKQEILEKVLEVMQENKEFIIDWLVKEAGSTVFKATAEFGVSVNILKEATTFPFRMEGKILPSRQAGKENRVYRNSIGVIGIISPWNFPFHLAIRSIAPAIATGNAVVIKPATDTPVTGGLLFASIFEAAGLPKGLLNVVVGRGSEIGDDIVTHPIPRLISFTGSTPVGKHIGELAGGALKKTALELGGNNNFIVLNDANVDQAVDSALFGKFYHQGQICMSINRIFVHRDLYDEFAEQFIARAGKLKFGNPTEEGAQVGPLINRDQVDRILKDIDATVEQGAKLRLGGQADGNVLEPTVLTDVTNDMPLAENEIFGPVAILIPFDNDEEVIEMANAYPFGLSGAVHSGNIERGTNIAHQIHTGMIHVNDQPVNDEAHMPFGGEKDSGLGRFNGEWVLEEFTTLKWLSVQHGRSEYGPFVNDTKK